MVYVDCLFLFFNGFVFCVLIVFFGCFVSWGRYSDGRELTPSAVEAPFLHTSNNPSHWPYRHWGI